MSTTDADPRERTSQLWLARFTYERTSMESRCLLFAPDEDMSSVLIEWAMRGQYGLAKTKWTQQLEQIRALPEVKR